MKSWGICYHLVQLISAAGASVENKKLQLTHSLAVPKKARLSCHSWGPDHFDPEYMRCPTMCSTKFCPLVVIRIRFTGELLSSWFLLGYLPFPSSRVISCHLQFTSTGPMGHDLIWMPCPCFHFFRRTALERCDALNDPRLEWKPTRLVAGRSRRDCVRPGDTRAVAPGVCGQGQWVEPFENQPTWEFG